MKYLLRMLFITIAFIIVAPFVLLYCLWDLNFSMLKDMWNDQKSLLSIDIYKLFKIKTKHLPIYYDKRNTTSRTSSSERAGGR